MTNKGFLPREKWYLLEDLASEERWDIVVDFQEHMGQRQRFSINDVLKQIKKEEV